MKPLMSAFITHSQVQGQLIWKGKLPYQFVRLLYDWGSARQGKSGWSILVKSRISNQLWDLDRLAKK